jgi:hypothetical protein
MPVGFDRPAGGHPQRGQANAGEDVPSRVLI